MTMPELDRLFFGNREAFRTWLETNHDKSPGIWIVFYKKHTGIPCITYPEALDEALCYGWIDSLIKKIDGNRFARKFTPRINPAKWSELNKKMADELIRSGRMTIHGLLMIESYRKTGKVEWPSEEPRVKPEREVTAPDFIYAAFSENEPALTHFQKLPQSCKREYILWITQAKKEETISKRLKEAIEMLKHNQKLGLK
jgi:uncharacterized protein YdeI (YjbR/CyaY-like superfamily)